MNELNPLTATPTEHTCSHKKRCLHTYVLLLILLASISISIYLFSLNKIFKVHNQTAELNLSKVTEINEKLVLQNTDLSNKLKTSNMMSDISTWGKYTSSKYKFSVSIPQTWRYIETVGWVGFGPKEIQEDVLIGLNIYTSKNNSFKQIIDRSGAQFEDRVQNTNTISVNGLEATEVITTTPSIGNWYSRLIIIEKNDYIYTISNGAMNDEDIQGERGVPTDYMFENFLQSFQINN